MPPPLFGTPVFVLEKEKPLREEMKVGIWGIGQPEAQLPHFPCPPTWRPFLSTSVEHHGWNKINNITHWTNNIKVHFWHLKELKDNIITKTQNFIKKNT